MVFIHPTTNTTTRVANLLLELDRRNEEVRILKGAVGAVLKFVTHVNEAKVKWKAQEISKNGETPLLVAINEEVGVQLLHNVT
jgi:potassium-transporting ATPase ATP-binding subunit